ncbi:MAG: acyl carrier protein [Myxococcales bacterium]|nr:acyl carrier protein [Myxococcales bacterium]
MSGIDDGTLLVGIQQVAREHLDFDGELTPDSDLLGTLALDSVRLLTLVMELENHFDINLEEGDEVGIETVHDLMDVLRDRLSQQGAV